MVGIYLIMNKITSECYIGQSTNIENRFRSHRNGIKNKKYVLYSDMRFYGLDNFDFTILEYCDKSLLDTREMFWIKEYQTRGYSLYNIIGVPQKERAYARRRNKKPSKKYR